jgi:hypothetical protein
VKPIAKPAHGTFDVPLWQIYGAGAAVCVALALGAWAVAVRPILSGRAETRALAGQLTARVRDAADRAAALDAANRQLDLTKAALARTPLRLESDSMLNRRLARVTTLAAESGLRMDEIQPGAPEDGPHYRTLPVRIVANGPYAACCTFLHRLRSEFPDTGARAFEATNAAPDPENPVATLRLELLWFTALPGAHGTPGL